MKLKDWLKANRQSFRDSDLRFIVKSLFSKEHPLFLEEGHCLDHRKVQRLERIKELYARGVPLAYILGRESFFGREFKVNPAVLIPRPETELLTEKAAVIINQHSLRVILDLGCGSGNIGITLQKMALKNITVFSSDISFPAVEMAQKNARLHRAAIKLVNADLLSAFQKETFDLIISNPPYVETEAIKDSLNYEPRPALEAGEDGLYFIERILKSASLFLKNTGFLILEIGYQHKNPVRNLIRILNSYEIIEWVKDYSGHWRGVVLRNKKLQSH